MGKVPEDWKKARITPIFKKGKKKNLGNYKLVSHTLFLGKVMKQIFQMC